MYSLSEQQINFIQDDILARGVEMESLQHCLLDHVCCIIENEYNGEEDFETFYQSVITTFYKKELWELEEETILLITFKNYHIMKKVTLISGIAAAAFLSTGIFFKFMFWPGAAMFILVGILLMAMLFLPMLFVLRAKDNIGNRDKALTASGVLLAILLSFHILFKVFHWPGANLLFTLTGCLLLIFIPVYFFTGYRNEQNRQNTVMMTVLMILGIGLFMVPYRTPAYTKIKAQNASKIYVQSENLLQRERALVQKNNFSLVKGSLNENIYELCETIKSDLIKNESGLSIDQALRQTDNTLGDSPARDHFENSEKYMNQLTSLSESLSQYNKKVSEPSLQLYDQNTLKELVHAENVLTILCLLNQVQLQMLQDEKQLLASAH